MAQETKLSEQTIATFAKLKPSVPVDDAQTILMTRQIVLLDLIMQSLSKIEAAIVRREY